MDASIIPDSLWGKCIDAIITVATPVIILFTKRTHDRSDKQDQEIQKLQLEHGVFKTNVENLTININEVKANTGKIIDLLLQRGHQDWRK